MLFAVIDKPGRATAEVLAEAIPALVRAFPWPKSQRWGAASISTESLRWVRPLSGIVALLGEKLVECAVGGLRSGVATKGHRFHCPGEITIGSAHDYADKLRACHVVVSHEERQDLIRTRAAETGRWIATWRDAETLARHALAVTPDNHVAHLNLGQALVARGELAAGRRERGGIGFEGGVLGERDAGGEDEKRGDEAAEGG